MGALASGSATVPASHKPLVDAVAGLFEIPKFSDFVVKCDDHQWKVHKFIVGARSDFFEKACAGHFKEGTEGFIILHDDDKHVVNEMLRYLYTADYRDQIIAVDSFMTPLLFNVHIHTIADKYNIPALAQLAEKKFAERAKSACNGEDTEDFAAAIEEMYATAPHSKKILQDCVINISVAHAKELYEKDLGVEFREVASRTPEFTSEFASLIVSGKHPFVPDEVRYKCNSCEETWVARAPPNSGKGFHCMQCGYGQKLSNAFAFWSIADGAK